MKAAILTLALLLGVLTVPSQPSQATGTGHPWWSDPDQPAVTHPGQFRQGWNLRVPLRVDAGSTPLAAGAPIQAHLDLGQEAIKAGWPQLAGKATSFTLDPDSVRLVRYGPSWSTILYEGKPVAATVHADWLQPDQTARYGRVQNNPFDPNSNPVITVEWKLEMAVSAFTAAHYYVYFEITQNSNKPPAEHDPLLMGPLDAHYWTGAGTRLFGHHPGADTFVPTITIVGTKPDTKVTMHYYPGTSNFPVKDTRQMPGNPTGPDHPFTLGAGQTQAWTLGTQPTHFMVEADKPVIVLNRAGQGSADFLPASGGGLLGTHFYVPRGSNYVFLVAPDLTGDPNARVEFTTTGLNDQTGCGGVALPFGQTYCRLQILDGGLAEITITNGHPALVQYTPPTTQYIPNTQPRTWSQAPTIHGSPVGHSFLAATRPTANGGIGVQTFDPALVTVQDRSGGAFRTYADDLSLVPGPPQFVSGQGMVFSTRPLRDETPPLTILANPTTETGDLPTMRVLHGARNNAPAPQTTPFGGAQARSFLVQAPFAVFPFYEGTSVQVALDERTESATLSRAQALTVPDGGWGTVIASKPVTVFPLGQPTHYSRFLAAQPAFMEPHALTGEYRGYLINVRSADGQDPVFFEALPGDIVRVPFIVENKGRWDGASLEDTVHLETVPPGAATFEHSNLALTSPQPVRTYMDVHVPSDMDVNSQLTISVLGTSVGNENMKSEFKTVIFTRQKFGVDLWFGPPSSDVGDCCLTEGFTPGEVQLIPFVVKNVGTGLDTFQLTMAGLNGGWETQFLDEGVPVEKVGPLDAGTQAGLDLRVRAPETLEVADVILTLTAASEPPQTATKSIRLHARLDLGRDVEMGLAEPLRRAAPGETVRFPVMVENTGKQPISLLFELVDTLPPGWHARFAGLGDPVQGPLSIGANVRVTVPIDVTVPADAPARLLATSLLRATGASDGDRDISASAAFTVEVLPTTRLLVDGPIEAPGVPGQTLPIRLTLTNEGNDNEELRVLVVAPGGWTAEATPIIPLPRHGGQRDVTINISVPQDAPAGPVSLRVVVQAGDTEVTHDLTVLVAADRTLAWHQPAPLAVRPGQTIEIQAVLANQGNTDETVQITATAQPQPWPIQATPSQVDIPVGATRLIIVTWAVPWNAQGNATITASAAADGTTATLTIPVTVAPPDIIVEEVIGPEVPPRPGELAFVTVILRNPTAAAAEGAQVRLLADDRLIDGVRFESVGPNGTVVAPLRWVGDAENATVRLVWGLERDGVFTAAGERSLQDGGKAMEAGGGAPGPAVPFVLALAWAAAVIMRRHQPGRRRG